MSRKSQLYKIIILGLVLIIFFPYFIFATDKNPYALYVGWSTKNITPDKPVALDGQFHTRISAEALDSITCTALAIETRDGARSVETAIMVACDLVIIDDKLYDEVIRLLKEKLPGFDSNKLILNATHTHTAPVMDNTFGYDIPEYAIQPREYVNFASKKIIEAVIEAWTSRKVAGMSWGLGQAVVGYNRRAVYFDPISGDFGEGTAVMYGDTKRDDFSHIEGYEDHGVEMMFFWDEKRKLTGMVLNIACTAQETEGISNLSADFWHDARLELRKRYGDDIFILPQVAASGDITPHLMWRKEAETEMLRRKGITRRQEIAIRIANAVDEVFPYVQNDIKYDINFCHLYNEIPLPVRKVTKKELDQSVKLAIEQPDRATWHKLIIERYNTQEKNPYYLAKVNVLRLGDVVIASNPFELFLDFGLRIKNNSDAFLTFIVEIANGHGSYLPTARAEEGGGYSAIVQSNPVGSEGGQVLVEKTIEMIKQTR